MVTILMTSAKFSAPDFLKIKIFQEKSYSPIIADYDVTTKILARDSNGIVYVVM